MTRALYLSAAHKSSGKTTLAIGICAALAQRGRKVQPYKKGPDFIDPIWLGAAAGRACFNLDFYTMHRAQIRALFEQRRADAELVLVEGNKGLFDGMALDGSDSNAGMAEFLELPVVLVLDTRGITRGIAPLLLGYQAFAGDLPIRGVILNRVAGRRHEDKLRQVLEHYTDLPLLGAVPNDERMHIDERHLGLVPGNEFGDPAAQIRLLAQIATAHIDLDRLLQAGRELPPCPPDHVQPPPSDLRIGYLRDRAFGFYYPDDLERLRLAGAELVPIDALRETRLPAIDGLFIGGGFPEIAMAELEGNAGLRQSIRAFIEGDGPVYAECGGLMYLTRSLRWGDACHQMVGAIAADTLMHQRPQGRGYVRLEETGKAPWGRIGSATGELPAHEFHHSSLIDLEPGYSFAFRVKRGTGIDGHNDGLIHRNLLASYSHLRGVGDNHWPSRFVDLVRKVKENGRRGTSDP